MFALPSVVSMNLLFVAEYEYCRVFKIYSSLETELGTDASLAETPFSYVLAFRGTELTSLSDLKTNAKATLIRAAQQAECIKVFSKRINRLKIR